MSTPPLRSFRTENFKAIRDSGRIEFGWLTVFIGNNGAGKSSLVEALETFRDVVVDGVDSAFQRWLGFEHVWNKAVPHNLRNAAEQRPHETNAMGFSLHWSRLKESLRLTQHITREEGGNSIFIQRERALQRRPGRTELWTRSDTGDITFKATDEARPNQQFAMPPCDDGESMLKQFAWNSLGRCQFLMLDPTRMGKRSPAAEGHELRDACPRWRKCRRIP